MSHLFKQFIQLSSNALKGAVPTRSITATKCIRNNYEGDGKTTVAFLNKEHKHLIMINTISDDGFRLSNGIFVIGPVAAFPRTVLQWNVSNYEDITAESLSLFTLLEPKLDIFILGTGDKRVLVKPEVLNLFKSKKINIEILPTEHACSTFNFLNVEGRCVAGAFIPPAEIQNYMEEWTLLDGSQTRDNSGYLM